MGAVDIISILFLTNLCSRSSNLILLSVRGSPPSPPVESSTNLDRGRVTLDATDLFYGLKKLDLEDDAALLEAGADPNQRGRHIFANYRPMLLEA